jgi:steroid-24-oyl-CoA synthetase
MWGTEVARGDGPVPFLVYEQRRRRVTELLDDAARWADRDHLVQGRRCCPSRSHPRAARTTPR